MALRPEAVTGLVLAGGEGRRLGGRDKGLVSYAGEPLALRALQRLRPQVGPLAISANRHLDDYAKFGVPVWPDDRPGFHGPLGGWLTALARCTTPWLASVPCDVPDFPADLVSRLAAPLQAQPDADIAIAAAGGRPHPLFALLRVSLLARLRQDFEAGQRGAMRWAAAQRLVVVDFEESEAFRNCNTPDDLGLAPADTNG
jgi:molybdopterin-guanine dinucleotide biosynthesis protein A